MLGCSSKEENDQISQKEQTMEFNLAEETDNEYVGYTKNEELQQTIVTENYSIKYSEGEIMIKVLVDYELG